MRFNSDDLTENDIARKAAIQKLFQAWNDFQTSFQCGTDQQLRDCTYMIEVLKNKKPQNDFDSGRIFSGASLVVEQKKMKPEVEKISLKALNKKEIISFLSILLLHFAFFSTWKLNFAQFIKW